MTILIETSGARTKFKKIIDNVDKFNWSKASPIMKASILKSFAMGGRYSTAKSPIGGGRKWKKRKDNKPHRILDKSGKMKNDILYKDMSGHLEIRSNKAYSAVHQFGSPKNNIASRPFITAQKKDKKDIGKEIVKHIKGIIL